MLISTSAQQRIRQTTSYSSTLTAHPSHDLVFGTSSANTPPQLKANAHPLQPKLSHHTPSVIQQLYICCAQETMSYWLGHADINTTHIYVEIDMEMKRQMLQKAGPPAVKKPLPWQKPDILQWLNSLAKTPQLCVVNH